MDATADLAAAAELDAWLKKHVAEPRRTLARGAASSLADYATCEEADLEDVLQISTWPPLARSRFLRAWRKLKGDEALTGTATVATQTEIVGPVQPFAAAAVPTGSSRAAAGAADDDDFEASDDDDDDDGVARNGPKRPETAARGRDFEILGRIKEKKQMARQVHGPTRRLPSSRFLRRRGGRRAQVQRGHTRRQAHGHSRDKSRRRRPAAAQAIAA